MSIKQIILLITLLAVFITIDVVVARKCFTSKTSKLAPREYFIKEVANRSDRHLMLLQMLYDSERPLTPDLQKLFDLILKKASSNNEREQWMSFYWTILLTGLSWHEIPDTLCLYASFLDATLEIENGDTDLDKFNCAIVEDLTTHLDMLYRLVKHALTKKGCSIANVSKVTIPDCFDQAKCIDGGKVYLFDKIWQEYNGTLEDNKYEFSDENDAQELHGVLKPLYESDNLYENHVAAAVTTIAMEYDWLIKCKALISESWYEYVMGLGLIAEAVASAPDCNCDDFEKLLLSSVKNYLRKAEGIIVHLKANKHLIESQGHLEDNKFTETFSTNYKIDANKRIHYEF